MEQQPVQQKKQQSTSVPAKKKKAASVPVRKEVTSRKIMTRSRVVLFVLFAAMLALCFRFAFLQLIDPEHYADRAVDQYTYDVKLEAKRGVIYARDGVTKLAVSATTQTVFISPSDIVSFADGDPAAEAKQIRMIAEGLADCLENYQAQTLIDKFNGLGTKKTAYRYLVVKKDISEEEEKKVRTFIRDNKLELQVALEEGTKRYYPYGSFAAQLLGFTGADNNGLIGLEYAYDEYLRGTDGRAVRAQDANGNELAYNYELYVPAEDGFNLVTTIDPTIQSIVEKYLKQAYEEHEPEGRASCVVMDVSTGEILALALYPAFDLNNYQTLSAEYQKKLDAFSLPEEGVIRTETEIKNYRTTLLNEMWSNTIVNQTYEPGSTFKIVTTAAALESGSITENDKFNCGHSIHIGSTTIHCWYGGDHGDQTLQEALVNSCNPAFVHIGFSLGAKEFTRYFKEFGYDSKTGTDIPGETSSIYYETTGAYFGDVSLAAYSFGQTFKVTLMEHIAGLSVVANGGNLVVPHVMKQITDKDGSIIEAFSTEPVRQVVSEEVCRKILTYLTNSTKNACVSGYNVVSKTGTSEKRDTKRDDDYVSSCVTFAPAADPQIAIIVTVDTPDVAQGYYGSVVAAPTVGRILGEVLPYMGIEPGEHVGADELTVPDCKGKSLYDAKALIEETGLKIIIKGDGDTVVSQMPAGGAKVSAGGSVILYTTDDPKIKMVKVPEKLIGASPEAAMKSLLGKDLNVRLSGIFNNDLSSCTVVSMSVKAGTEVPAGTVIVLECRYQSLND